MKAMNTRQCAYYRLRAKIERDPRHPCYVLTVWGVGYQFTDFLRPRRHSGMRTTLYSSSAAVLLGCSV